MNLYQVTYEVTDLGNPVEVDSVFVFGENEAYAITQAEAFVNGMTELLDSPTIRGQLKSILELPGGCMLAAVGMVAFPKDTDMNLLSQKVMALDESSKLVN